MTVDLTTLTDPVGVNAGPCNDAASEFTNCDSTEGDCIARVENATLGTGDDTFTGNGFNNAVQPGGQNVLDGAGGSDTLDYSVGYDAGVTVNLAGGAASDDAITSFENVIGTPFDDSITGDDGSNTLKSRKGKDNVRGGSGDDDLWGQKGNDYVNGGSGDDFCTGRPGKDKLKSCETGKK